VPAKADIKATLSMYKYLDNVRLRLAAAAAAAFGLHFGHELMTRLVQLQPAALPPTRCPCTAPPSTDQTKPTQP